MTLPKTLVPRTTVRLPEDVHRAAKAAAAQRVEPLQEFIAEAIRMRIRAHGMGHLLGEAQATPRRGR